MEGKDYVMVDGDVVELRFNARRRSAPGSMTIAGQELQDGRLETGMVLRSVV